MRDRRPTESPRQPTRVDLIAYRICEFSAGSCTCAKYARVPCARVPCARAEEIAESIIRTVLAEPKAYRSEVKR